MRKFLPYVTLGFFIIVFLVTSLLSMSRESLTFDEIVDFQEGRNAVLFHKFDVDPYNPPLTREIGVLPYLFNKEFYTNPSYAQNHPFAGRMMMVLLGLGLIISVFFFSKTKFGLSTATFTTFLLSLEPTILANSHFVTMDIGITLIFFLSYILFLSIINKFSSKKLFLLSVLVALGVSTKITFIPFFFISTIILILYKRFKIDFFNKKNTPLAALFIFTTLLVVWSTYFFNTHVVIKEREDNSRVSVRLLNYAKAHDNKLLAAIIIFGKTQTVPLGDFFATLKNNALRTLVKENCFFLGKYYSSCEWYFMPINLILKISLSVWILFAAGIIVLWKNKKDRKLLIYLLIPVVCVIIISMVFHLKPLVRYLLPIYPFVLLTAGTGWKSFWKYMSGKVLILIIIVMYVFAFINSFPHYISYSNEMLNFVNFKNLYLMDSNIDWGQSMPDVTEYVKQNKIGLLHFSYFGQENGNLYGLKSDKPYGSYKLPEICEFHNIKFSNSRKEITLISLSNWYQCNYYKQSKFKMPKGIVSDSFLVF